MTGLATEATRTTDERDPRLRLSMLLDSGSMVSFGDMDDSDVHTAEGTIDGARVIAYCTDGTTMSGAIGWAECISIVNAIETAVLRRCPIIGLWHSGGARLAEGIAAMDGVGRMFAAMIRASGKVPQLSLVLGAAAGGAAYGPALTDIVIMSPAGRIFVAGPGIVSAVTGEQIDMAGLGGPDVHSRRSGVAHVIASSEQDAYARTRRIVGLLAWPGQFDLAGLRDRKNLRTLIPENTRRAYDVRPLVHGILDDGDFEELQARWAPNVVVGFGRQAGRTVGVIANNPLRKGGCLDSLSAEKAARFVRMCDSFGIPLVVVVDVPGYLPGVRQEWDGVVRRGAKLLHAFGEAVVPRVTLITRKSYGGAYVAMNSRALGATRVFAWPDAEVAVMGSEAAVGLLHRRALAAAADSGREQLRARLIEKHRCEVGSIARGVSLGVIDEVIDPADTRGKLASALANAPAGRGMHSNIPL